MNHKIKKDEPKQQDKNRPFWTVFLYFFNHITKKDAAPNYSSWYAQR